MIFLVSVYLFVWFVFEQERSRVLLLLTKRLDEIGVETRDGLGERAVHVQRVQFENTLLGLGKVVEQFNLADGLEGKWIERYFLVRLILSPDFVAVLELAVRHDRVHLS